MFKIGAFSRLVHVSARMLRYYEQCGLIYPVKFDKVSGNRYYSAAQIPLLQRITALRDMGFTVAEIGDILDNYDDKDYVESMLTQKTDEVKGQMREFQARLDRMENMSTDISDGNYAESPEIIIKPIPSYQVISLRETLPDYSGQNDLWQRLFAYIGENNIQSALSGQLLCIYHSQEYAEKNVDIEVCAIVKEPVQVNDGFVLRETDAIPAAATAVFKGFYSEMALWEGIMAKWVEDNEYEVVGCEQCYCLQHILNCQDPDNYKTELQIPIREYKEN